MGSRGNECISILVHVRSSLFPGAKSTVRSELSSGVYVQRPLAIMTRPVLYNTVSVIYSKLLITPKLAKTHEHNF